MAGRPVYECPHQAVRGERRDVGEVDDVRDVRLARRADATVGGEGRDGGPNGGKVLVIDGTHVYRIAVPRDGDGEGDELPALVRFAAQLLEAVRVVGECSKVVAHRRPVMCGTRKPRAADPVVVALRPIVRVGHLAVRDAARPRVEDAVLVRDHDVALPCGGRGDAEGNSRKCVCAVGDLLPQMEVATLDHVGEWDLDQDALLVHVDRLRKALGQQVSFRCRELGDAIAAIGKIVRCGLGMPVLVRDQLQAVYGRVWWVGSAPYDDGAVRGVLQLEPRASK